jgi:hypothetical protein
VGREPGVGLRRRPVPREVRLPTDDRQPHGPDPRDLRARDQHRPARDTRSRRRRSAPPTCSARARSAPPTPTTRRRSAPRAPPRARPTASPSRSPTPGRRCATRPAPVVDKIKPQLEAAAAYAKEEPARTALGLAAAGAIIAGLVALARQSDDDSFR